MAQITVNELAVTLDTTTRTARKFLRSITPKEEQPGKGKRWQIEKRDVRSLVKQFKTFEADHTQMKMSDITPEDVVEAQEAADAAIRAAKRR